jgi:cytoskeletal protein CcmA (bactofilin family)
MNQQARGDLRIDGSGTSTGGEFDSVKINGSGRITGDLCCRLFRINGSGHVLGSLEAEDGKISGSGNIDGPVKARQFKISGSGKLRRGISGDNLTISGSATIGSDLNVQHITVDGSVKVDGNCSGETFHVNGGFDINGLLNCDEITADLYQCRSRVKDIGGSKIRINLGTASGFRLIKAILTLGSEQTILEADSIEGDEIVLENTAAKVVRGSQVTIGRGCVIDLVEYKERYDKSADARVGEARHV